MRLSPHLTTHLPLRLALAEQQRELADFSQRSHLHEALDACGVDAALEMPQQFWLVSLGEAFSALVSVAKPHTAARVPCWHKGSLLCSCVV